MKKVNHFIQEIPSVNYIKAATCVHFVDFSMQDKTDG